MSDDRLSQRQQAWDLCLGLACTAVAVAVHLGGSEAVSRNHDPGVFSVALTVLAVGPLVVRRRWPMAVLALTLLGLLLLVATRNTVGVSTIGCAVAFCTTITLGSRRRMWHAVAVMVAGVATGLLMRPVDLSRGGAVTTLTLFCAAGLFGYGARERRERFEADVVAARERAARTVTDERLRITRELHDILGHAMSVMVVQAGVAERLLDTDPARARAAVAQIGTTGRRSLAEMRQVLGALRESTNPGDGPDRDPMPGLGQLPALVARIEAAGLPVRLTVTGVPDGLPPALELAAYRVVQESLTNCLKHAHASRAQVEVEVGDDGVRVQVSDDGTGGRQGTGSAAAGTGGHGLAGMRERVSVFGGDVSAGPTPGGGFRVSARLPVAAPTGADHRP